MSSIQRADQWHSFQQENFTFCEKEENEDDEDQNNPQANQPKPEYVDTQYNFTDGQDVNYRSIYIQTYQTIIEPSDQALWAPILSHYRIEKFISKGAYGIVYKAQCLRNKRTVAIKMIGNF